MTRTARFFRACCFAAGIAVGLALLILGTVSAYAPR
jgi:hypothetical protein